MSPIGTNRLNYYGLKSIGFIKRMKFVTPISNFRLVYSAYLYDAPNTPEPLYRLYFLCSKRHNRLPKSVDPNNVSEVSETLVANDENCDLSASLPTDLYSRTVGIQYVDEHDPYSPLLSVYEHSRCCRLESEDLDNVPEYLLSVHDNDIWSPILYRHLTYLPNDCFCDCLAYRKDKKFIETKVPALKMQGFNH